MRKALILIGIDRQATVRLRSPTIRSRRVHADERALELGVV